MSVPKGPVLIDLEDEGAAAPRPDEAPPVPDDDGAGGAPTGAAMPT